MPVTTKDRLEFVHAMARHTKATVRQCEALMRYAGTLQRLAKLVADHGDSSTYTEKRMHIRGKVHEVLMNIGADEHDKWCHPIFSGDPRGAVLKIRVPDGFSNSIGDDGICVPS